MKLQVFGTGCQKCRELENRVKLAMMKLALDAEVEKVTDISQIADAGVMLTPALSIDGKVVLTGNLPSVEKLMTIITTKLAESEDSD